MYNCGNMWLIIYGALYIRYIICICIRKPDSQRSKSDVGDALLLVVTYSLFQVQLPPVAVHFGLAAGSLAKTQNPSISVPFSPFVLGDQMLSQGRWYDGVGRLQKVNSRYAMVVFSGRLSKVCIFGSPKKWWCPKIGMSRPSATGFLAHGNYITSQAPLVVWLSLSQVCICTNMFATIKITKVGDFSRIYGMHVWDLSERNLLPYVLNSWKEDSESSLGMVFSSGAANSTEFNRCFLASLSIQSVLVCILPHHKKHSTQNIKTSHTNLGPRLFCLPILILLGLLSPLKRRRYMYIYIYIEFGMLYGL